MNHKNVATSITFMEKNVNSAKDIIDKMNDKGKIGMEIIKLYVGLLPKFGERNKIKSHCEKD